MNPPSESTLTIGHLARRAGVGIETVRYYQGRGLLPVPDGDGGYRRYPIALVDRIRFIKRAQELGFSLNEIASLLALEDGENRAAVRAITSERLHQIEAKLKDLKRMRTTLHHLLDACEHGRRSLPCPIIETLASPEPAAPTRRTDSNRRPTASRPAEGSRRPSAQVTNR